MKTFVPYLLLIALFCSCSSDDNSVNTILEGRTYRLTEFNIEIAVDGNGDDVYSTNLVEEDPYDCFVMNSLGFRNGISDYLLQYGNHFDVNENNEQEVSCYVIDYFSEGPNYSVNDDGTIVIIGDDEGNIEGNTIVFLFTNENFEPIGRVLEEDGALTDYQGSITMVFTLNTQ